MRECEQYEILVSAWQDGELDRAGQVEMLDHLAGCPGCREFYRDVRRLDGLADAFRPAAPVEQPSPGIWERIERAVRPGDPVRRFPIGAWAAAAAAMFVLLVALGSRMGRQPVPADPGAGAPAVRLGGNPEGMNDARFIAMTEQVLASDRKYREAFYQVMKQVIEDTGGHEASVDTFRLRGEGRRTSESAGAARGRS